MSTQSISPKTRKYVTEYNRGWQANDNADIDAAGSTSNAWYDGYHDAAAGRVKWTWRKARLAGFVDMNEYMDTLTEAQRVKILGIRLS
jgi:hypothetical protein